MRVRDFPIRRNLALLILFASGSAVVIASVGFAIYAGQRFRAAALREATALADTLGTNTAAAIQFSDRPSAREILAPCRRARRTWRQPLRQPRPRLRNLSFCWRRIQSHAVNLWHRRRGVWPRRLTLSQGVFLHRQRTGSIVIVLSLSEFPSVLMQYVKIAALVFLLSVFSAWLASMFLARLISDPLIRLSEIASGWQKKKTIRCARILGREAKPDCSSNHSTTCFRRSRSARRRSRMRSALCARAKSAMRWQLAAPTTACGTGT